MACSSIVALLRACGTGVIAGTEAFWMVAYNDLSANTITQQVYSADTSGTTQAIYLAATKKFVEVDILKSTAGSKEVFTIDPTKGLNFVTATFTLVLSDLTPANLAFIQSIRNQPVVLLYRTRTEVYFVQGLTGNMFAKTIEGGSGVAEADFIGWNITFENLSLNPAPIVNTAIISGLIS